MRRKKRQEEVPRLQWLQNRGNEEAVVKIANVSTPANFVKGKTLLKVRAIIPVSEISS